MTTAIEVLDTTVKIGLGATISFFATYSLSKLNHSKEVEKAKREERKKIIKQIALNLESMDSKLNEATHLCNQLKKEESRDLFVQAMGQCDQIKALSNLISNYRIFELSDAIAEMVSKSYTEVGRLELTPENVQDINNEINTTKAQIYPEIQQEYKKYV